MSAGDGRWSILQRLIAAAVAIAIVLSVTYAQLSGRDKLYQAAMPPKDVVTAYLEQTYGARDPEGAAKKYIAFDVKEHGLASAAASTGLERRPWPGTTIRNLVSNGDLVIAHYVTAPPGSSSGEYVIEIFRVLSGSIVERWRVAQSGPIGAAEGQGT